MARNVDPTQLELDLGTSADESVGCPETKEDARNGSPHTKAVEQLIVGLAFHLSRWDLAA